LSSRPASERLSENHRSALLTVHGLSKSFPGLRALDGVSFSLSAGEIVAVVGQNGSGKSTLVKLLAGVLEPDPGASVWLHGDRLASAGASFIPDGLHFIHQDLGLVSTLSAIENLDLTSRRRAREWWMPFNNAAERSRARELIARFGTNFDVEVPVSRLSPEERTIVAIARAMDGWTRRDEVLVLDEPTAALQGQEVERLFVAVRHMAAEGAGVIFISHRLDEVLSLADRVLALRDGQVVADVATSELDRRGLVRAIAGRDVSSTAHTGRKGGRVVFRACRVSGGTVREASLSISEGEIVGVYGLLGSGREQLGQLLYGARPRTAGVVTVSDCELRNGDPAHAIASKVAFVPSDRHQDGAVMSLSMRENLTLPLLRPLTARSGAVRAGREREEARAWASRIELRPPEPERALALFSGGNQQKVVLASRLRAGPCVLVLDEPTQGVDVAAKAALYGLIAAAAEEGAGILISSSDTEELVLLCDRVLVMREGLIAAVVHADHLSEEILVAESLGLSRRAAQALVTHD
jgi:ABC-type sugar transport system ATPase subunit